MTLGELDRLSKLEARVTELEFLLEYNYVRRDGVYCPHCHRCVGSAVMLPGADPICGYCGKSVFEQPEKQNG
jgi:hypothetical protein